MNTADSPAGFDLSLLNEPQREAVTHGEGALLILAGAGSGKTRVITHRIAHLLSQGVKPWHILAVTFTNKAAGEMKQRVYQLAGNNASGIWISTYHSFCAQFLRVEGPGAGLDRNFTIYDDDDQKKVIKECLRELHLDDKKINPGHLASQISREKDRLIDAESFAINADVSRDPSKEVLASVYSLYQKKLDRAVALDFGDLIMKTVQFLYAHTALRQKYQERFQWVLVDEYQDTNRAQYVLTKLLAEHHKNICVVGDDDQSIYSWRGADIRNILDFEKDYPSVKVVKLEQNYRSTQPILTAAWNLVQHNEMRKEKKLWTSRASDVPVTVDEFRNELEEADWLASQILTLTRDGTYRLADCALFYRTNAQSRVLEDAMRRADIPYRVVGNVRFYERAEVKDVIAYLKLMTNTNDDLSFKRIVNTPPRGIGKTTLETMAKFASERSVSLYEASGQAELTSQLPKRARESLIEFRKMIEAWRQSLDSATIFRRVQEVLEQTHMLTLLKEESRTDLESAARLDNVRELLNAAEEFEEKSTDRGVRAYLEQVSLVTDMDSWDEKKDCTTMMTVHIAKGLEFPAVFLTGMEEGLFPLGESQFSQDDLEEERRLAYVGMTRAKNHLFLTSSASRRLFGQVHWNRPSRFISEAGLTPSVIPNKSTFIADDEPPSRKSSLFRVGDRVHHPDFGYGKVVKQSGTDEDPKVVVEFETGTWRKFLLKYAPLTKA